MISAPTVVSSASNPIVKRIRRLADRKHRWSDRAFVVEGVQPVERALRAGAPVEVLVTAPDLVEGTPGQEVVARFESGGGRVVRVTAELFERLSRRDGPTGLAAIIGMEPQRLADLVVDPASLFVALYEVANPGNLGTIIRTADSLGVGGVVLVGSTADPFSPEAVKASMGSLFALPVVPVASVEELLQWTQAMAISVVTTSAHGSASLLDVSFPAPCLLMLGSEGAGLPADVRSRSDLDVRVPMLGSASSFNLAVAAGIVLYAAARPRLVAVDDD